MKRILFYTFSILAFCLYGCDNYDDQRLPGPPRAYRNLFGTVECLRRTRLYGIADLCKKLSAERLFVDSQQLFRFGGVLLACGLNNELLAYDMACPIECQSNVRIEVDEEAGIAVCQ